MKPYRNYILSVIFLFFVALIGRGNISTAISSNLAAGKLGTESVTVEIATTADTYAASAQAERNVAHGDRPGVFVGYGDDSAFNLETTRSFVKFDLSGYPHAQILDARLEMYLTFATYDAPGQTMPIEVRQIAQAWGESTLTWANQPTFAGSSVATTVVDATTGRWISWTLPASVIQGWINNPGGNHGFALISPQYEGPGKHIRNFYSREYQTGKYATKLILTISDVPTVTPTFTATNTATPTSTPTPTPTPPIDTFPEYLHLVLTNQPRGPVRPGEAITYTLSYSNTSDVVLTNVLVRGNIPAETEYISGTVSGGEYLDIDKKVVKTVGFLFPGEGGSITYSVRVLDPTNTLPIANRSQAERPVLQQDAPSAAAAFLLGGRVWQDNNGNGIRDEEEQDFVNSLGLSILNPGGLERQETINGGWYLLTVDSEGLYRLTLNSLPAWWQVTTGNPITVSLTITDPRSLNLNFGVRPPAETAIGGSIWLDQNRDGIRNTDELLSPLAVGVKITDLDNNSRSASADQGTYLIENLDYSIYEVELLDVPRGWRWTTPRVQTRLLSSASPQLFDVNFGLASLSIVNSADGQSDQSGFVQSNVVYNSENPSTVFLPYAANRYFEPTPTSTSTPTPTPTSTWTATPTPTPSFTPTATPTFVGDGYEPDDSFELAKPIVPGQSQVRSINPETDVDWIQFSLTTPSTIVLETSGDSGNDTRMWLYDQTLSEIKFDDDGGVDLYSRIYVPCLQAGTYFIKIDDYANDTIIPAYSILLNQTQPCATSKVYGTITQDGVVAPGVSLDMYYYDGTAWSIYGQTVTNQFGIYEFVDVPDPGENQGLIVIYGLNSSDPSRLWKRQSFLGRRTLNRGVMSTTFR